jgi:V/A-type H+-transporting ATPase subunit E
MATSVSQSPGADVLARAIIAQAQEEAEQIRAAAKAEAEALVAAAEAEAAQRYQAAAEEEKARALKEKSKMLALVDLEARRRVLHAREELIERVFARVTEACTALRQEARYAELLQQLIQEGITALVGEEFLVEVAPEDVPLAERARAALAAKGYRVVVQAHDGINGGCVIWSGDRHTLYDNSFASILARHKERLRPLVASWLFGDETDWQG